MKVYPFLENPEEMRERLRIWHHGFIVDGMTQGQSVHFLKELYLQCGQAFGWTPEFYNEMVEWATK